MIAVLVQIDAETALGAPQSVYASSIDDPSCCHLNNQIWWPVLGVLPALAYDLFSGAFDGKLTTPSSSLTLSVEPWPNLPSWRFADARIQIWVGDVGAPWASYTRRFNGIVTEQPAVEDGRASLSFQVDDRWLDDPLLDLYEGSGGVEGSIDLKGTAKPLALGAPRYAPATMLDSVALIAQISAYGAIEGVEQMLEMASRNGAPIANYPDYATLETATVPRGTTATALAQGLIRHGAPPAGMISYHVRGDNGGPNGWARLPGQIIRRIALLSGGAGKIDDASLDALDAAATTLPDGGYMSLVQTEQTTARALIQRIAASYNCSAGVSWLGKLFVAPVALGLQSDVLSGEDGSSIATEDGFIIGMDGAAAAAQIVISADGDALPAVAEVKQLAAGAPAWRVAIQAERTWQLHGIADIAFDAKINPAGVYKADRTYRIGDLVSLPNKSEWLYINATPSAGHAPPDPSAGNAWWENIAPAPGADVLLYADGRSIEDLQPDEAGAQITRSLDLSQSGITFVFGGPTIYPGQLPFYVKSTLIKANLDDTAATSFTISSTSAVTATIDNAVGSPTRGLVTITGCTGAGTVTVTAVSGNVVLTKTISIDTKGLLADQSLVGTPLIEAGAVTRSIALTSASAVTGSGSPPSTVNTTVLSYSLTLDVDSVVLIFINGAQTFSGSADWAGVLAVNGAEIASAFAGAGYAQGSFSRQAARNLAATAPGSPHTIQLLWRGSSGVTLTAGASLIIFVAKR